MTAVNEGGPSEKSESIEYDSPPAAPDSPDNLSAEPLSTSELVLSWMKPSSNGSTITGYKIIVFERSETRGRQQIHQQSVSAATTSYSVQNLEAETVYE